MKFKSKIINKLKSLLESQNSISKDVFISISNKIYGTSISDKVKLQENNTIVKSNIAGAITILNNNKIENSKISGKITIGNNCKIHFATLSGYINIGNYTSFWGPNIDITCNENSPVFIGNYCSIARNVTIQSFNHNFKKATSYYIGQNFFKEKWENEKVTKGNVVIKNDVWIGTHCVILGGITIENGALIAANSVVNTDVPAYAIVAGSPAKVIGYRFDKEIIDKLVKLEWWNWNDEKIKTNKSFFENEIDSNSFNAIK